MSIFRKKKKEISNHVKKSDKEVFYVIRKIASDKNIGICKDQLINIISLDLSLKFYSLYDANAFIYYLSKIGKIEFNEYHPKKVER